MKNDALVKRIARAEWQVRDARGDMRDAFRDLSLARRGVEACKAGEDEVRAVARLQAARINFCDKAEAYLLARSVRKWRREDLDEAKRRAAELAT